jgi:hydrogenase maturation protease
MAGVLLALGIGNEARRDDAAGLLVARRLAAAPPSGWRIAECRPDGAALVELWRGCQGVLIFDAARCDADPGSVLEFGPDALQCTHSGVASGHHLGLTEAVALARALGEMPAWFRVLAVVGQDFDYGFGCSAAVSAGIERAAQQARVLLARPAAANPVAN